MIDIVVVGAGRMGRLHARTVARCPQTRLVGVVDPHPDRAAALANAHGCAALTAVPDVDLVIVATPAHSHVTVVSPLMERMRVLVEKPVAVGLDEGSVLRHANVWVAQSERFHPAWAGTRIRRRFTSVRAAPNGPVDVDVVGDLLIHDLDLLHAQHPEAEVQSAVGIHGPHGLDEVTAELTFASGCATLHASRIAGRHRCLTVDGRPLDLALGRGPDPLTRQLWAVLHHLRTGRGAVTAHEALDVLAKAETVRAACA